jgi:two-component system chemotaxis response regulator CheY
MEPAHMAKKILIVDDSMLGRMVVKSGLPADLPLEVAEAADGAQGLELFLKDRPDMVFLDLTMPVMSGPEALEKMRAADPHAVVVVVSADAQQRTIDRVMELGAFMMLKKPPKKEEIHAALLKALARRAELTGA